MIPAVLAPMTDKEIEEEGWHVTFLADACALLALSSAPGMRR